MGRLRYIFHCILHMDYKGFFRTLREAKKRSQKNIFWLFWDIIKCGFRYGAGYTDYLLYRFYDLTDAQRATYVTRGINNSVVKKMNTPEYYHIFENKPEFNRQFASFLGHGWLDLSKATPEDFAAFTADKEEIICKPADATCGVGIEKLRKKDFASIDEMYARVKEMGTGIVEEVILQHPDMSRIYPVSVNTVRVYTVFAEGKAEVFYACLRMGNSDRPVDNIHAGGLFAPLDMETGKVAFPACDSMQNVYEHHPRTGCLLPGYQIPWWKETVELCRRAAQVVPQVGYVGWDVAITEHGPVFIEANNHPCHDAFPQMALHSPDRTGYLPTLRKFVPGL